MGDFLGIGSEDRNISVIDLFEPKVSYYVKNNNFEETGPSIEEMIESVVKMLNEITDKVNNSDLQQKITILF